MLSAWLSCQGIRPVQRIGQAHVHDAQTQGVSLSLRRGAFLLTGVTRYVILNAWNELTPLTGPRSSNLFHTSLRFTATTLT